MVGAVPFGFSTLDLSGKFIMNKSLSDDPNEILKLQGIGWILRTAINLASVSVGIKHYKDDDGVENLIMDEYTTTGGLSTTTEHRKLSWKETEHVDFVFGATIVKSRRCKAEDIKEEYLTRGWTEETYEHGLIQAFVKSNTPKNGLVWTANEAWGVEEIKGEKRYTRRVVFTGPKGQAINARIVYDHTWQ
ncbi:hypothetical protein JOM56_007071 [Amanita muscaria]|uniref:Uncharacterized protein n=1 Tax=Amanita muscaria (strain Koide BX008) TaxID=946122 RepID=A0A0C2X1N1_AMAMK|nr:hypothetical protein M378DRAFT_165464 [Amanita muscaria Koide BX008]